MITRRWLWTLITCLVASPAIADDLTPENRDYDQKHIKIDLTFDFEKKAVRGTCAITLVPLRDDMKRIRFHAQDITVDDIHVGGVPVRSYRVKDGLIAVELPSALSRDQEAIITFFYESVPSRGLYFFAPTEDHPEIPYQVWSQGEDRNNHFWFPCYDEPDDRMTSELIAHVPADMQVISNGEMVSRDIGGEMATFHFKMDQRHVPYLVSVIAGKFDHVTDKWEDIPLHYYVPPGQEHLVEAIFGRTPDMMDFFSVYTGRKYPYSRYSQTTVYEFIVGGMENTTATTLNMRALYDERAGLDYSADSLIAHEMAHMWFGDLITCLNWKEMWLNEGFATYFTDLYFEDTAGRDEFLIRRRGSIDGWTSRSTPATRGPIRAKQTDRRVPLELPEGHNYAKGASILHLLRDVMGDEKFMKAMRTYVARHADTNPTSEELRAILEEVHGESLQAIFDEWVYGAGYPELEVAWEYDPEKKEGALHVKQVQDETSGLFHVPVTVRFTHVTEEGLSHTRERIHLTKEEDTFTFPMDEEPFIVRFDEGDTVPKRMKFPKTLKHLEAQAMADPDVTARMDALDDLATMGEEGARILEKALEDAQAAVRASAARHLGKIQSEGSLQVLLDAMDDEESSVRSEAASSLGGYPAERVEDVLITLLQEDRSWAVQESAARALGQCKSKKGIRPLLDALQRGSHRYRVEIAAASALADAGDRSVLPDLIAAVQKMSDSHGRSSHRNAAVRSLAHLGAGDAGTVKALLGFLDHPSRWTRISAARGLGRAAGLEALPDILARAREETDDRVKRALEDAAAEIARRASPGAP